MVGNARYVATVALTLLAVVAVQAAFVAVVLAMALPVVGIPGLALASVLERTTGIGSGTTVLAAATVVLAAVALAWAQLRYARRTALAEADVDPSGDYRDIQDRVRRIAMTAGVEAPRVAVSDSPAPNSFGIGGPRPTIVVSEGLVERLSGAELDAVLAHELAHVRNRDATVMTMAAFLPALASDHYSLLKESVPLGWREGSVIGAVALVAATGFVLVELGAVGILYPMLLGMGLMVDYLFGGLVVDHLARLNCTIAQFLSRRREYAADRTAARLTGDPAALAAALSELDGTEIPTQDARWEGAVRSLSLLPSVGNEGNTPGLLDRGGDPWGSHRTHPPTDDRIDRLRAMTAEIESA